jgi:hypothetical protein
MATKQQYATWALKLAEGEDHFVDELYEALIEDGIVDYRNKLIIEDEYENDEE